MEQVEHWWNGSWGVMSRRDLWLWTDGDMWRVGARKRTDGKTWTRDYFDEETARTELAALKTRGADKWTAT